MSSSAPQRQPLPEARPFAYAEAGVSSGTVSPVAPGGPTNPAECGSELSTEGRIERQQAEAFERGRQAAQLQFRAELDAALAKHHQAIGRAVHEFSEERKNYYRRIEGEVVALALAIARKILHREVQIDPQALAGIVRVTLEKLDIGTKIEVRVHPREATDWRHYFACQADDAPAPEVHEDASIAAGECRIVTSMGSTEVGLETQLKEIETGLLDLLAERPSGVAETH